jgi:hypothetical protein
MSTNLRSDLLAGARAIARHTGLGVRQVYYLHQTRQLATFQLGTTICARKSELDSQLSAKRDGEIIVERDSTA